jgi:FlaA1/EpsC-like NDP-sugar epimerase
VLFAELMTLAVMFTLTRLDGIPRSMPLIHGVLLAGGLIGARMAVRIVFGEAEESQDYQSRRERIVIIGANRFAAAFIQLLRAYAPLREPVIAVLDEDSGMVGRAVAGVQVIGRPHELDAIIGEFAVHGVDTDRVVVAGEVDFLSPAVLGEIERARHGATRIFPSQARFRHRGIGRPDPFILSAVFDSRPDGPA